MAFTQIRWSWFIVEFYVDFADVENDGCDAAGLIFWADCGIVLAPDVFQALSLA